MNDYRMTNKEAIEEIRSCLGVNNIIMPYSDEMIAFGMAIEALQKADEYRWHDLREDPEDLPKNHDRILFFTTDYDDDHEERYYTGEYFKGIGFSNDDHEGYVTIGSYNNDEVLAWRYIEPFEGE